MMKYHKAVLALFFSVGMLNTASACDDGHWITNVSSDGSVVILEDGSVWEVDSLDQIDSQLWLSTENIIACDDKLVNTDEGEVVGATQLQ